MAHVMKPGTNIPGPFSNSTYIPTMTHGWVHANTWYASAPFNAAPPPVPAGVNPQTWMNGQWQPNPMFRPQPGMTQTSVPMWAPHPGWGAAVAQAHNPFKRVPNPGDASYWATKLSDNPLGLENMHIRDDTPANERHLKDQSNGVPHTPWVWVPKDLAKEGSAPPASNGTNVQPQHQQARQEQSRQSQPDKVLPPPPVIPPLPPSFSQPPSQSSRDHVRTNSHPRTAYDSSAYDQSRSNDRPPPTSAPATMSSYSAFQQQQQQQQQQRQQQESQRAQERSQMPQYQQSQYQQPDSAQHHARQRSRDVSPRPPSGEQPQPAQAQPYSSHYRSHTTSSASSSASAAAAAVTASRSATTPVQSSRDREADRDREAYSAQREMHLTFSPNIVRTPDHYSSPPSRRTSYEDVERTPSRTPGPAHGSIYGPSSNTPSRSNSMRRQTSGSSSSTPSSTSTSASTTPTGSSSLGLLMFTEEPQGLLSPLVVGGTPPASTKASPGREVSRSQTYPTQNVYTIPEEQERKTFPRTPRSYERASSRSRDSDRDWDQRDRERDREDRERDRDRRDRERDRERERDVNSTPQPANRTPPSRTPPSSYYTRPSPESGSHHARQISRSHTLPMANSPSTSPRHGSSPYSQSQQYSSSTPYSGSSSYARTSPNPNPAHSRGTSPLRHNPLPRPPAHSAYTESLSNRGSSSASAAAAVHHQQQQSTSRRQQVRHGYWNRRGDHLYVTDKGERFIVYAPHHLANPEELKYYPSPTEGFLDHNRNFIKYDPSVPELLDSLPLQGRSPARPYSSFVHLVDV